MLGETSLQIICSWEVLIYIYIFFNYSRKVILEKLLLRWDPVFFSWKIGVHIRNVKLKRTDLSSGKKAPFLYILIWFEIVYADTVISPVVFWKIIHLTRRNSMARVLQAPVMAQSECLRQLYDSHSISVIALKQWVYHNKRTIKLKKIMNVIWILTCNNYLKTRMTAFLTHLTRWVVWQTPIVQMGLLAVTMVILRMTMMGMWRWGHGYWDRHVGSATQKGNKKRIWLMRKSWMLF